jgi:hypothetical protein
VISILSLKRQRNLTKKLTRVKLGLATEPQAGYKNCSAKKKSRLPRSHPIRVFRSLLQKNYASSDLIASILGEVALSWLVYEITGSVSGVEDTR